MTSYIRKLKNAEVYFDGDKLLGAVKEVDLGEIKHKMSEFTGLGMIGTLEFGDGLMEAINPKFTWNSLYPEVIEKAANPNTTLSIQVRCKEAVYTSGSVEVGEFMCSLNVRFKNLPLGTHKTGEAFEGVQTEATLDSLRLLMDNEEKLELDIYSGTFRVNGKDVEL